MTMGPNQATPPRAQPVQPVAGPDTAPADVTAAPTAPLLGPHGPRRVSHITSSKTIFARVGALEIAGIAALIGGIATGGIVIGTIGCVVLALSGLVYGLVSRKVQAAAIEAEEKANRIADIGEKYGEGAAKAAELLFHHIEGGIFYYGEYFYIGREDANHMAHGALVAFSDVYSQLWELMPPQGSFDEPAYNKKMQRYYDPFHQSFSFSRDLDGYDIALQAAWEFSRCFLKARDAGATRIDATNAARSCVTEYCVACKAANALYFKAAATSGTHLPPRNIRYMIVYRTASRAARTFTEEYISRPPAETHAQALKVAREAAIACVEEELRKWLIAIEASFEHDTDRVDQLDPLFQGTTYRISIEERISFLAAQMPEGVLDQGPSFRDANYFARCAINSVFWTFEKLHNALCAQAPNFLWHDVGIAANRAAWTVAEKHVRDAYLAARDSDRISAGAGSTPRTDRSVEFYIAITDIIPEIFMAACATRTSAFWNQAIQNQYPYLVFPASETATVAAIRGTVPRVVSSLNQISENRPPEYATCAAWAFSTTYRDKISQGGAAEAAFSAGEVAARDLIGFLDTIDSGDHEKALFSAKFLLEVIRVGRDHRRSIPTIEEGKAALLAYHNSIYRLIKHPGDPGDDQAASDLGTSNEAVIAALGNFHRAALSAGSSHQEAIRYATVCFTSNPLIGTWHVPAKDRLAARISLLKTVTDALHGAFGNIQFMAPDEGLLQRILLFFDDAYKLAADLEGPGNPPLACAEAAASLYQEVCIRVLMEAGKNYGDAASLAAEAATIAAHLFRSAYLAAPAATRIRDATAAVEAFADSLDGQQWFKLTGMTIQDNAQAHAIAKEFHLRRKYEAAIAAHLASRPRLTRKRN